jgi:hypothetical protein
VVLRYTDGTFVPSDDAITYDHAHVHGWLDCGGYGQQKFTVTILTNLEGVVFRVFKADLPAEELMRCYADFSLATVVYRNNSPELTEINDDDHLYSSDGKLLVVHDKGWNLVEAFNFDLLNAA